MTTAHETRRLSKMTDKQQDMLHDISIADMCSVISSREQAYKDEIRRFKKTNEWHDLRKNPNDLPGHTRNVWTNIGPSYYDIEDHCWRDEFGRTQGVIAWCEPKFEEKI
jgi:hypothetical protein